MLKCQKECSQQQHSSSTPQIPRKKEKREKLTRKQEMTAGQMDAVQSHDGEPTLSQSAYVFGQKISTNKQVQVLEDQKSNKQHKNMRNVLRTLVLFKKKKTSPPGILFGKHTARCCCTTSAGVCYNENIL